MADTDKEEGDAAIPGIYQQFIQDFSHIVQPLFQLTGNVEFQWGEEQEEAFQELQQQIIESPVLILADDLKPF